jgi:hypothetical protein
MSATTPPSTPQLPRRSWSARLFSLPTVMGLALVSFLFLFTGTSEEVGGLGDPDVWWHLRNASQLLTSGHFIRSETWTFTVGGKPWLDFEWLAELPYYFAYRHYGDRGLYLMMMVLVSAIIVGVYCLACLRSGDSKAAFLASFVGLHFVTVSLGPRTLLFGWLFLVLELAILWNLEKGRDYTAWLPPLFLLWINTHGSWFIGFALMVVFFACGFVRGEWGNVYATPWTRDQKRKFLIVTAASAALVFINPYGWRLVAYPFDVAYQQKLTIQYISEWYSINFHVFRGKAALATLVLFTVLQLVHKRRWRLTDLVLLLIAVYGGFTYVRFVYLLGIVIVPLLAMELLNMLGPPYDAAKDRRFPNIVAIVVLVAIAAFCWPSDKKLHSVISQTYPEKALPYIRSIAGRGNVFNDFEWGGYLEWQAPQMPEFIDGRVDIFVHDGIMRDYLDAIHIQNSLGVLDKYQIRYVLISKRFPLAYLLKQSAEWKISYEDDRAIAFERLH